MPLASCRGGITWRLVSDFYIRASSVSAQGTVGLLPGCRIPVTPESLLMLTLLSAIPFRFQIYSHRRDAEGSLNQYSRLGRGKGRGWRKMDFVQQCAATHSHL